MAPKYEFRKCVARYDGDHHCHPAGITLPCLCPADPSIEPQGYRATLNAMEGRLIIWASGAALPQYPRRSKRGRSWRIYEDFAQVLIMQARKLYQGDDYNLDVEGDDMPWTQPQWIYVFLIPWARFRKTKAAVKLHIADLRGDIPTVIVVQTGPSTM